MFGRTPAQRRPARCSMTAPLATPCTLARLSGVDLMFEPSCQYFHQTPPGVLIFCVRSGSNVQYFLLCCPAERAENLKRAVCCYVLCAMCFGLTARGCFVTGHGSRIEGDARSEAHGVDATATAVLLRGPAVRGLLRGRRQHPPPHQASPVPCGARLHSLTARLAVLAPAVGTHFCICCQDQSRWWGVWWSGSGLRSPMNRDA